MQVKTVCLSILYEGEASGYEIRRLCIEGECSYFVEASFGSIYPALAKLEAEGLVTSRIEQQEGRPAKKIYAITDEGRAAFVQMLFEPIGEDLFRSPFLLFVRFAHLLPRSLVEQRLEERLEQAAQEEQQLREALEKHGDHAPDAWVINYGLTCMQTAHTYLRDHMDELIALARADDDELADAAE